MSVNIITQFNSKPGCAGELIALMRKLLPDNPRQSGCEDLAIRQNQDDSTEIITVARWASRQHYDTYAAGQCQHGLNGQLDAMLVGHIQVRYFDDIPSAQAPPKGNSLRPHTLHREVPKISTSDAPGG